MSRKFPRWLAVFALAFTLPLSIPLAHDAHSQSTKEIFNRAFEFMLEENYTKAAPLFRKAAEQGHVGAQYILGSLYDQGQGVKQDYEQALKWYRKVEAQGEATAQWALGWMYEKGKGVKQDSKQAAEWFHKAAEQGYSISLHQLALMYEEGRGVKQDSTAAYALHLVFDIEAEIEPEENRYIQRIKITLTKEEIEKAIKIAGKWKALIKVNKRKKKKRNR